MEGSPASLKQSFNCVHIIQLDFSALVQRHGPSFHLSNGLQAREGSMGLRKAWPLPVMPFTSVRGPSNEFPGVALASLQTGVRVLSDLHSDSHAGIQVSSLALPQHPQPPLSHILAHLSSLHLVNPINKELRKFIRSEPFIDSAKAFFLLLSPKKGIKAPLSLYNLLMSHPGSTSSVINIFTKYASPGRSR